MTSELPKTSPLQQFNALRRRLGIAGPLALISAFGPTIGLATLTALATKTEMVAGMAAHRPVAITCYLLVAWTLGALLLPTYASAVLAGYVFGFGTGTGVALAGYLGASCGTFLIGRRVARERLAGIVQEHPRLRAVQRAIAGRSVAQSTITVILFRLSPATPFALTNLAFAAAGLRWRAFLVGTMLGVLPRTIAVVGIASQMAELKFTGEEGRWLVIAGVAITLLAVLVIGKLVRRELDRQLSEPAVPAPK